MKAGGVLCLLGLLGVGVSASSNNSIYEGLHRSFLRGPPKGSPVSTPLSLDSSEVTSTTSNYPGGRVVVHKRYIVRQPGATSEDSVATYQSLPKTIRRKVEKPSKVYKKSADTSYTSTEIPAGRIVSTKYYVTESIEDSDEEETSASSEDDSSSFSTSIETELPSKSKKTVVTKNTLPSALTDLVNSAYTLEKGQTRVMEFVDDNNHNVRAKLTALPMSSLSEDKKKVYKSMASKKDFSFSEEKEMKKGTSKKRSEPLVKEIIQTEKWILPFQQPYKKSPKKEEVKEKIVEKVVEEKEKSIEVPAPKIIEVPTPKIIEVPTPKIIEVPTPKIIEAPKVEVPVPTVETTIVEPKTITVVESPKYNEMKTYLFRGQILEPTEVVEKEVVKEVSIPSFSSTSSFYTTEEASLFIPEMKPVIVPKVEVEEVKVPEVKVEEVIIPIKEKSSTSSLEIVKPKVETVEVKEEVIQPEKKIVFVKSSSSSSSSSSIKKKKDGKVHVIEVHEPIVKSTKRVKKRAPKRVTAKRRISTGRRPQPRRRVSTSRRQRKVISKRRVPKKSFSQRIGLSRRRSGTWRRSSKRVRSTKGKRMQLSRKKSSRRVPPRSKIVSKKRVVPKKAAYKKKPLTKRRKTYKVVSRKSKDFNDIHAANTRKTLSKRERDEREAAKRKVLQAVKTSKKGTNPDDQFHVTLREKK